MSRLARDIRYQLIDALRPVWALLRTVHEDLLDADHPYHKEGIVWYLIVQDVAPRAQESSRLAWELSKDDVGPLNDIVVEAAELLDVTALLAQQMNEHDLPHGDEEYGEARRALAGLGRRFDRLFLRVLEMNDACTEYDDQRMTLRRAELDASGNKEYRYRLSIASPPEVLDALRERLGARAGDCVLFRDSGAVGIGRKASPEDARALRTVLEAVRDESAEAPEKGLRQYFRDPVG